MGVLVLSVAKLDHSGSFGTLLAFRPGLETETHSLLGVVICLLKTVQVFGSKIRKLSLYGARLCIF